ncbi:hypothetical protein CTEN210_08401 [Chaetoceros tenuissimus]|uniref:Uncharacterized protein n=1 Tax=Chaetoceros tenuissimus TaxID=426638 RepID=A0AAD3CVU0_9STRA|nr:hypothetical protein CTEN210_08401 [Chaetoceros tenuissimus]
MAADERPVLASLFTSKNRSQWIDTRFWQDMLKEASVNLTTSKPWTRNNEAMLESNNNDLRDRIRNTGYTLVPSLEKMVSNTKQESHLNTLISNLAKGITFLHKNYGLPATYILLFDEAWELAFHPSTQQIISQTNHEKNIFNFDILAWYIDPSEGASGFSPHRDRQPSNEVVPSSFHEDGQAKYITLWIALTNATPQNSCLYVIPKQYDPGYMKGDDKEDDDENEDQDDNVINLCLVVYKISNPIKIYVHFQETLETIRACYEYCKENRDELDEGYYKKVSMEFVKAMKECREGESTKSEESKHHQQTKNIDIESGNDSEEEDEAMLEAMLENADDADDDFDDDFGDEAFLEEDEASDVDGDEEEECVDLFALKPDEPDAKKRKIGED